MSDHTEREGLLDVRAAAIALSDVLHAMEHAGFEIPDPLDRAWLKLSQTIEASTPR